MTIRTIIADDEELARRGLRSLSQRCQDLRVICECTNGQETVDAIFRHRPDLVFLDVQMPGKTGFDVISSVPEMQLPYVVFVTAYDKFALRAFEVQALDYLLKPVNHERFDAALARVRGAISLAAGNTTGSRVREAAADLRLGQKKTAVDRLPIKVNGRIVVIRVPDIDWIEADGDYVSVHVGGKTWLMRETIAAVESRLALCGFVRIHRSFLVNAERVKELRPQDKGEYTVVLEDGKELKLTRNYRTSVASLVGGQL